jgi:carbon monoxide dehydrogenase subunit G
VEVAMTTLRHEIHAACPPEAVWALLSDIAAVHRYNPGISAARIEGMQRSGVGATRSCDLKPKGRVVERVTHWEEGRVIGLEVAESDWPIHFMNWITRVEPSGSGTRISQALHYRVKLGPIGWLLDHLVMRRKMTKSLDEIFASLARLAERDAARELTAVGAGKSRAT